MVLVSHLGRAGDNNAEHCLDIVVELDFKPWVGTRGSRLAGEPGCRSKAHNWLQRPAR